MVNRSSYYGIEQKKMDADNILVKLVKLMIMSKIPKIQPRLRKGSWSQASLCPLCCQLRNTALWDKQLSGLMNLAVSSQHMTKMGLCSTVCVCIAIQRQPTMWTFLYVMPLLLWAQSIQLGKTIYTWVKGIMICRMSLFHVQFLEKAIFLLLFVGNKHIKNFVVLVFLIYVSWDKRLIHEYSYVRLDNYNYLQIFSSILHCTSWAGISYQYF